MFCNCHGVPTSKVHVFYSVEFFFYIGHNDKSEDPQFVCGEFFFGGGGEWVCLFGGGGRNLIKL